MVAVLEWREYGDQRLKVFVVSPGFVISNLRGTSEEARSGWGMAGSADVPGELILNVIEGKRTPLRIVNHKKSFAMGNEKHKLLQTFFKVKMLYPKRNNSLNLWIERICAS